LGLSSIGALSFDILILFIFKYLDFLIAIINKIFSLNLPLCQIALPIGISFYTFQIISYVIDVYRGNVVAANNILKLGLYISLFPQLIAGPIVRYADIEKQIDKRKATWEGVEYGAIRFMEGFAKKILIADQLSSLVDYSFSGLYPSWLLKWIGIIAYTLQIYYDFSGYSDMAIGLGKIFGFDFLENFNYPYISESVQEFWRKWHISLGSWFKDYLYIPLGGNRKGDIRTLFNLFVVFLFTGLWHGANYNFVVWGIYYAFFIILERCGLNKQLIRLPKWIRHLYLLTIVTFGWILFRADGILEALNYIKEMFTIRDMSFEYFSFVMNAQYWFFLVIGIFFAIPHNYLKEWHKNNTYADVLYKVSLIIVFIIAISYMVGSGYSPFLYFRF